MPTECQVEDILRIYWLSHNQFILETESHTTGVPKAHCFYGLSRIHLYDTGVQRFFNIKMQLVFTESTFLEGTIISASKPEYEDATKNILLPSVLERLANYEKTHPKSSKLPSIIPNSSNTSSNPSQFSLAGQNATLFQSISSEEKVNKRIVGLEKKTKFLETLVYALGFLNILLLIILYFIRF